MQNIKRAIPVTIVTVATLAADRSMNAQLLAVPNEYGANSIGKVLESGSAVAFDGASILADNPRVVAVTSVGVVDSVGRIKVNRGEYMARVECVKWVKVEVSLDCALLTGNLLGVADTRMPDDAPSTDAPSTDAPSTDAPKRRGRPRKNA